MQTINYSFLSGLLQQQDFTAFYLAIAMGAIQELLKRANYNSTPILSQPSLLQSAYWLPLLAILPSLREDFRINHPNDFFQSVNNSLVEMIYFTLNATLLLSTAAHVNTYAMQLRNRLTRTRQSITTRLHNYKTLTLCLGMFFLGYLSTRSNNHGLQQV